MRLYVFLPLIQQRLLWPFSRALLYFFTRLKVNGLERLNSLPQNCIFAVNHASQLDPVILPTALPFFTKFIPMFFTANPPEFFKGFGWKSFFYTSGLFFKSWGAYPVVRDVKNYEVSLARQIVLLNDNCPLLIFPEGGITKDGHTREPKGGVGYLAARTRCPVIPVAISGSFQISPQRFFSRKHTISVSFGEPFRYEDLFTLPQTELGVENYKNAALQIMERIKSML